jgi:hypothetical protein
MKSEQDLEGRIASAYSDLEPSAAVEDAIRAGLAAEQVLPGHRHSAFWLLPIAVAVALGVALAPGRGTMAGLGDGEDAIPALPVVTRPQIGVVLAGEEWIRVRLCRDGRILVPPAAEAAGAERPGDATPWRIVAPRPPRPWRQVSLAGLARHLDEAAQAFDKAETAAGRSGFETTADGVRFSLLRLVLFADRDAAWQHVQWILTVCAERRMPRVAFAAKSPGVEFEDHLAGAEEKALQLDAALPVDLGLRQEPSVKVGVLVKSGETRPGTPSARRNRRSSRQSPAGW